MICAEFKLQELRVVFFLVKRKLGAESGNLKGKVTVTNFHIPFIIHAAHGWTFASVLTL